MVPTAGMYSIRPKVLPKLTKQDWINEQAADSNLSKVIKLIKTDQHLKYKCAGSDSDEAKLLMQFHRDL